jgi:demethylmenaquinone methyltransferase/2-methoxy-6-polyprenyl-1,4-benzoquinol methylase
MQMKAEEIYRTRKQFFNDHAEAWLDRCYKNPKTGQYDRHQKDFDRLFALVPLMPGDKVLDAGCGSGVLVPWILQRITQTGILIELDFAEKMIETNRNLHRAKNIRFLVADVAEAPLEAESCDAILCFSCFPHFHDKEKTLRTLSRILRKGGIFAVAHFDSSEGIKKHHESCQAVMHDHLPVQSEMYALLQEAALNIDLFIDEPGFYCVLAKKQP